jgi:hypothetical protein
LVIDEPFRGLAAPWDPDGKFPGTQRLNKDMFANWKAQSWWHLRTLFQNTGRALDGMKVDLDRIISIDSRIPELTDLLMELSQPTYSINSAGKIIVAKAPDGSRSPNFADAVMISFAPGSRALRMEIWRGIGRSGPPLYSHIRG